MVDMPHDRDHGRTRHKGGLIIHDVEEPLLHVGFGYPFDAVPHSTSSCAVSASITSLI